MPASLSPAIPVLPDAESSLIPAQLISRSYTWGEQRYMRRYVGDTLHFSVALQKAVANAQFVMVTNLGGSNSDDWQELPLERLDKREFVFEVPLTQRGLFCFRLRYSPDGGKSWLWDRVPASWVMVDPAHVAGIKMYTLIPSASGPCTAWTALLPKIRQMGFNMIHLLPLTTMDASHSPYAASDLFGLDPLYADPNDSREPMAQFDAFVERAKELEIGICIDLVFNHVGMTSQLARRRPEWIMADERERDGFRRAGWQGPEGWNKWLDLVLLDYGHPVATIRQELWEYMGAYCHSWAAFAARTRGMIRLDNLHSSHEDFTIWVLDCLRAEFPELVIFAELFADTATNERLIRNYGLNLLLGTQWEHHFVPELRRYLNYIHAVPQRVRYFLPVSTHDSGTPTQEFGDPRSTLPRYAISCFYSHGITGMSQGVEFGAARKIDFINRTAPIRLSGDIDYREVISRFHEILDAFPVFHQNGNICFIDDQHHAIIAAWRGDVANTRHGFLLLTNFDIHGSQSLTLDFQKYGLDLDGIELRDELSDSRLTVHGDRMAIMLPPCGVHVYRVHDPGASAAQ